VNREHIVWRGCILVLVFVFIHSVNGGENQIAVREPEHQLFSAGTSEFELSAGAFFSLDSGYTYRPTINFAAEKLRVGLMLYNPHGSGLLAGNTELLLEGFAGQVFAGPGTTIAGGSALLRYNFIHPRAWVVPYFQVGVGGAYNDIVNDESQSLLGSEDQILLQAGLGARVPMNNRLSLMVESDLIHLSNGGSTQRNHGLNCLGGQAGLALSF